MTCFGLTLIGYMLLIIPGLLMHFLTIVDAYKYAERRQLRLLRELRWETQPDATVRQQHRQH